MKGIAVIITFLSLIACKKETPKDIDPIQGIYGTKFSRTSYEISSNFQVYAHGTKITDPNIHSRFKTLDSFFLAHTISFLLFSVDRTSVKVTDADNAIVDNQGLIDTCKYVVDENRIILTRRDTLSGLHAIDPFSLLPNYYLVKYTPPLFGEWIESSTRGQYIFGYLTSKQHVFEYVGGRFEAPYIVYRLYREGNIFRSFILNNFVRESFSHEIAVGDTLDFLTGKIVYLRD